MSTLTITLAGNQYSIQAFTLRQVRDIATIVAGYMDHLTADNAERVSRSWDRKFKTIVVALGRNYPEITEEALESLVATADEIDTVYLEILKFSGLTKDDTPDGNKPSDAPLTALEEAA